MQKGNPLPLGTNPRGLIYQLDSKGAAAIEHIVEIID
jgi:hypothetical protein